MSPRNAIRANYTVMKIKDSDIAPVPQNFYVVLMRNEKCLECFAVRASKCTQTKASSEIKYTKTEQSISSY